MSKIWKKNLALFFLEEKKCSQCLGVDDYNTIKKNNDKNDQNNSIKVIFSLGKSLREDLNKSERAGYMEERENSITIVPFLKEINCDLDDIKKFSEKKNLKKYLIGGVVLYKNQESGGIYIIGIIDKNLKVIFLNQKL